MIEENLCADFDIRKHINQLNISDNSKRSLDYWITRQEDLGVDCKDFIYGMALALLNEQKITQEDFITLVMWAPEKNRKEESGWKSFLRSICCWRR